MAKNCNLGQLSYGKTMGDSAEQRRGGSSTEERGVGRGCYKLKVHWCKLGAGKCSGLSLAELLPGQEEIFLPPAGIVK